MSPSYNGFTAGLLQLESSLIESDAPHADDYYNVGMHASKLSGEQRMASEILLTAVQDIQRYPISHPLVQDALLWIAGSPALLSFESCCLLVQLAPDALRDGIWRWIRKHRHMPPEAIFKVIEAATPSPVPRGKGLRPHRFIMDMPRDVQGFLDDTNRIFQRGPVLKAIAWFVNTPPPDMNVNVAKEAAAAVANLMSSVSGRALYRTLFEAGYRVKSALAELEQIQIYEIVSPKLWYGLVIGALASSGVRF